MMDVFVSDPVESTLAVMTASRVPIVTDASTITLLTEALECAACAASGDAPLQWEGTIIGAAIELRLNTWGEPALTDSAARERAIACGRALENVKVALWRWGKTARIKLLPDEASPGLFARVTLGSTHSPTRLDTLLFRAATTRRATGGTYTSAAIPPRLIAAMGYAAELEGAWLKQMTDDLRRSAIASLVTGRDRDAVRDASFVAAIMTRGDTMREWIISGQALQLVTLVAAAHGVSATVLGEPVRSPAFRARLRPLIGPSGSPQIVTTWGMVRRQPD